ncbi:RING finger protein nhl-1 isoform X4 [Sitodiplosis mosellana]|uniref:RING finger protein nhl-1 isoform X4 n=1 Tax=Sitodiplosis mosellana TaxID=263140 RepID=UPI002445114C|nr:RING finger protein nhl-1 isoform X4 [Sitodiplosis mosellana]XP_055310205.1 RING finger protein nhl-1 isoform X4 [Sitodiplosis mosellana]XP_055310206.1 RING finger protein nhl-1 isoform X4 [Sitodiplosis mosellana]
MEHFEQLLTCCVCLDRYRNPKLLPCQHSFCMEPCMEGLVDYVRRQVKCPECRAEHRIPYQGVQAFPTNVTLQRFLELRMEITGEPPDPTSGQIMERCNVCSEKSYLSPCAHCDKKICEDCKSAHMDILRREINRINSQVRRGVNRLQDSLAIVEKNTLGLQSNCLSVSEEVEEIYRRLGKALKDRTDFLRTEIDRYLTTELRNLTTLKENLDLEIANIQSNCDVADKYMNENIEWDDCELMDTKEIFLRTVEFLRSFEYENTDYTRRVRFLMSIDPNQLVMSVSRFGELNITPAPHSAGVSSGSNSLQPPSGPGLMRSKSDHRLATQFRQQQEERGIRDEDEPVLSGRKFGERPSRMTTNDRYGNDGGSRYSRGGNEYDYGNDYDESSTRSQPKSRFRSRFVRSHQQDDSDTEQNRAVRFHEKEKEKERERVLDTEHVSRGNLSGIIRLADSPRVMKRLQESDRPKKEKKEPVPTPAAPKQPTVQPKRPTTNAPPAQRQMSEDEIDRIKRQNKGSTSTTTTPVTPAPEPERPISERVAALKTRTTSNVSSTASDDSDNGSATSPVRRTPPTHAEPIKTVSAGAPSTVAKKPPTTRSGSTDSTTSTESSASSTTVTSTTRNVQSATKQTTKPEVPQVSSRPRGSIELVPEKKPFKSRFLPNHQTAKKDETESSSSEEETTSEESDNDEEEQVPKSSMAVNGATRRDSYANRNSQSRDSHVDPIRSSRDEPHKSRVGGYSSPTYGRDSDDSKSTAISSPRSRATAQQHNEYEDHGSRYGPGSSSYQSRFLNKSKSSAVVALQPSIDDDNTGEDSDNKYGTGRSRYLALKERRNRLARSRSSHLMGNDDEDILDQPVSPTTASPNAYLASRRYGATGLSSGAGSSSGASDLARSRSSHALKAREASPLRSATTSIANDDKDGAALSSWARYLKNKYGQGNRSKDSSRDVNSSTANTSTAGTSSTSANSRRLSLGLPLRQANEIASSDDDSKNGPGSPTTTAATGITGVPGISPRTQYLQKRRQLFQLGGRGSEPGCFTWPRGIAVGPDNSIVVADSSNHRVQVFDSNGIFVKEFGQYGNGEGEFDCLAGVAVNRIGQYIIADRYNHRIQVLDPQGRFLRSFGTQGIADGKFNYPWGVTTDALGFIYVCDKENHRVQVFQSDGTFVGKFGTCGKEEGNLEHPHYIAVSNTNRVIVSDSNNHRIQVFDVNGRVLSTFGNEGSEEGQFKFPRGVAVDDQGYICVADSGNNRIQIFHPDGSFLRAFGSWGSGDAEFKGLEGVAIMSNGNILVCDRENHRVQVF